MTFGRRFGLVAALENEDMDLPAADVDTSADTADSPESAMLEMETAASEVDAGTEAVEQTSADAEQLDAIADKMEESEETGGMDETSAAIAEVAVEAIYARLGVTRRKPLPAMESFGSASSRLRSTKLAVEGIREMASKAWAAIVEFCKKIKDFFVKLWKFVSDASFRNEERAKKLAAKVASLPDEAKEKEVEAGSFAKGLTVAGAFDAGKIAEGLKTIGQNVGVDDAQIKSLDSAAHDFMKMITDGKAMDGFTKQPGGSVLKTETKSRDGFAFHGFANSGEMLGGVSVAVEAPTGTAAGKEAAEKWATVSVTTLVSKAASEFKAEKVATASKEQQTAITGGVVTLAGGVKRADASIKKTTALLDSLIKMAGEASKAAKEDKDAEGRAKLVRKLITTSVNTVVKGTKEIGSHAVRTSKAALDYVEKSQKQFGAAEKKTEEKA